MSENNRAESGSESESDDDIWVAIKRKDGTLDPPRPWSTTRPAKHPCPLICLRCPGIPINTTRPPDVSIEDWKLPYWARPGFVPTAQDKYWGFIQVKTKDPNAPLTCRGRKETTRAHRYNLRPRGIITNKNPLKKHRYVLRLSSKKSKLN